MAKPKPKLCWICNKPLPVGSKLRLHLSCERAYAPEYRPSGYTLIPVGSKVVNKMYMNEYGKLFDEY